VTSESLRYRLVEWMKFPKLRLILGVFLLLIGLLSGLFLAAIFMPDVSSLPRSDNQVLPIGIRIVSESGPKMADTVRPELDEKTDITTVVPKGVAETSLEDAKKKSEPPISTDEFHETVAKKAELAPKKSGENEVSQKPEVHREAVEEVEQAVEPAHPVAKDESRKAIEKASEPVPGTVGEEIVPEVDELHKVVEETTPIVVVKEPLSGEAAPSVSGQVVTQGVNEAPQKELVDQDGIEKILGTGELWNYTTTEEDTLWRIAKKFYGSGYYFPVLMECNPSLGIFDMEKGMRVKIFKDNRLVQRLYNEITCIEGNGICYYYRVVEGDTFETVALKFYNQEGPAKRIMDLNPRGKLSSGRRIKIPLD